MSFPTAVVFSSGVSLVCFSTLILVLKGRRILNESALELIAMLAAGTLLNQVGSLLHELAHAITAKAYGLGVAWGGRITGYTITTNPPIYDAGAWAQTAVSLAGPAMSLLIVVPIWILLGRSRKTSVTVVLAYLLYTQGLGNFGSLLYIFSGDARNFAQGFSELTHFNLEAVAAALIISSILWTWAVIKKIRNNVPLW